MGTIIKRKKKNGEFSYTGQIRILKDGKKFTKSKTGSNIKDVQRWMSLAEAQLKQPGVLESLHREVVTVGQVLKWYEEDFGGASKFGRSKLSSVRFLQTCFSVCDLDVVNLKASDLVNHARIRASGGTGPATINTDFVWLRNAFKYARIGRDTPANLQALDDAAELLRREKSIRKAKARNRRPSVEELDALLHYFNERDGRATLPMVEIVLFALFSGRRQEEITRIRWDDIDERRQGVLVRDMKHPREKVHTFTYFTDEAWALVQRQPRTSEFIYPYNSKSISSAFTRSCHVAGVDDLRFHDLRHECVSWLFELGWDIPRVSNVSGHKSWATLQRYTHLQHHDPYNKYEGWQWNPLRGSKA